MTLAVKPWSFGLFSLGRRKGEARTGEPKIMRSYSAASWPRSAASSWLLEPGLKAGRLERRGIAQDSRLPRILAMIWATTGWAASGRR